jgi:CRISPR type IV-associated protein Csf3
MSDMIPLRIEWRLTSPVAGMNLPLHLDALIAYALTEEALRHGTATGNIRDIAAELPLEKCEQGGLFCWKASALKPKNVLGHFMGRWTRKFPEAEFAQMFVDGKFSDVSTKPNPVTGKIDLKPYGIIMDTLRGPNKNHFQHIPMRHVDGFVAYCIGDKDRITELLLPESGYVTSIGARKRQSAGNILRSSEGFRITEDESANYMWKRRVMPWPEKGYEPIEAAHKPPYWAIENRTTSYIQEDLLF